MNSSLRMYIRAILEEDGVENDVTSQATVPPQKTCYVTLKAKQSGILSGISLFQGVMEEAGASPVNWNPIPKGSAFFTGEIIATFEGNARGVLAGERTAMNLIQHLSGIASITAAFVKAIEGCKAKICDTRKTTPLMRRLEKEAVRDGGGANHRFNLSDGVLIKENHIAAAGGISAAVNAARQSIHHLMKIEVEVRDLNELDEALAAGVEAVLLDNMDIPMLKQAVQRATGRGVLLEASGNMSLDRVRAVAQTGVDLISVGALTHSAPIVDMTLLIG